MRRYAPLSQPAARTSAVKIAPLRFRPTRRYDHGMTKVAKLTISLPQEQAEQVRQAVARGEASSVSGYISAALADAAVLPLAQDDDDTLADLLADMIAEYGPPDAEAYAWADEVLGLSSARDAE